AHRWSLGVRRLRRGRRTQRSSDRLPAREHPAPTWIRSVDRPTELRLPGDLRGQDGNPDTPALPRPHPRFHEDRHRPGQSLREITAESTLAMIGMTWSIPAI